MGADGDEHIAGQVDAVGPGGVREYFTEFFAAFPDFALEVRSTVTEGDRSAVHWTAVGTHLGSLWGVEPTGARVNFEGIDLLRVRDGLIVRNDAVADTLSIARQLGPRAGRRLGGRAPAVLGLQRQDAGRAAGGGQARARARRRRRLAPARRRAAHDERLPARGRGRRRDAVRRRHPLDDARAGRGGGAARRHQPDRARPRRRRPPRRRARPARAGVLPSRRPRGRGERRAAADLPPARPARDPGALRLPAPAQLLGRRRR